MNSRKLPTRRFGFTASMMMALFMLQSWSGHRTLAAQRVLVRMEGGNEAQIENHNQLKAIYETKRTAAKNRINAQLHDINQACDLSDAQRERLKVAGKGAVKSHAEKVLKKIESMAKTIGVDFKLGDPPRKAIDDEEAEGLRGGRLTVLDFGNERNGETELRVETETIWKKSIEKSLDEEQQEKLKAWLSEREKMNRKAAVDHLIAKADVKLFLSLQQREKLTGFVDKEYGEVLASNLGATPVNNQRFAVFGAPQQAPEIKVDDALKEILSEPQIQIWKTEFQQDLDSLN